MVVNGLNCCCCSIVGNIVQICLGGIRLRDHLSRLRIGVTDLGQVGMPLLVAFGGRNKHYALLWLVEGVVGERDGAMGHPDVFHNPKEVMRLMQGIQFEWSMLEQMLAPRRRSRSPRDGPV